MLAVLPVLLWLGSWQLERARQKQALFDRFGAVASPVSLEQVVDQSPQQLRYRPVRVAGRYLAERQFLLEGMSRDGRPGLHVWTPLQLAGGDLVIVDRGWVPEPGDRTVRLDLPVSTELREVSGRVVPYPEPGLRLAAEPGTGWPRRVLYPTAAELSAQLGKPVLPHLVWLDAASPDGYARDWRPAEFGPARHIGYAVQWFGLAVTLILIYLVLRFRRKKNDP